MRTIVVLERVGHLRLHITRVGEEGCWKGAGDDKRLTAMPTDYLTDLSVTEEVEDFGRDRQEGYTKTKAKRPKERQPDVPR